MRVRARWYIERAKLDTRERGGTSWHLCERAKDYPRDVGLAFIQGTFHSRGLARKVARLLNGTR